MTTFTNADFEGFKKFIKENNNVRMTSSQRCARDIYELANNLVKWSKTDKDLKNAFFEMYMEPVEGKNPVVNNSVKFEIFPVLQDEKNWVLDEILQLQKESSDYTYGILLRTNSQVIEWTDFLSKKGLKTICFIDSLKQKKIFSFLVKFLEVIQNPWENKLLAELYIEFVNIGTFKEDPEVLEFLKRKAGSPFIIFNPIEFNNENLVKFWWEVRYWLDSSENTPEELIIKLGSFYFTNIIDRSNIHLLCAIVKKFRNSGQISLNLPEIVKYLKELGKKSRISGVKLFSEADEEGKNTAFAGFVQLMTVHKSKGDEFDVVFMPEMYEKSFGFNYSITPENITVSEENLLMQKLDEFIDNSGKKSVLETKLEQAWENLRLIYVGITRAKRYLYMSSSHKDKYGGDVIPSKALEQFILSFLSGIKS